jgi:hypothetical protein
VSLPSAEDVGGNVFSMSPAISFIVPRVCVLIIHGLKRPSKHIKVENCRTWLEAYVRVLVDGAYLSREVLGILKLQEIKETYFRPDEIEYQKELHRNI